MIKVGMLWFDKRLTTDPETAVTEAISYYIKKYGRHPGMVCVNPSHLNDIKIEGVVVEGNRSVMINHVWVGEGG